MCFFHAERLTGRDDDDCVMKERRGLRHREMAGSRRQDLRGRALPCVGKAGAVLGRFAPSASPSSASLTRAPRHWAPTWTPALTEIAAILGSAARELLEQRAESPSTNAARAAPAPSSR